MNTQLNAAVSANFSTQHCSDTGTGPSHHILMLHWSFGLFFLFYLMTCRHPMEENYMQSCVQTLFSNYETFLLDCG